MEDMTTFNRRRSLRISVPVLIFSVFSALFFLVGEVASGEASDILWRAYSQGPAEKQELLKQAQKQLDLLQAKALDGKAGPTWHKVSEVRWLLNHRMPAVLVIERELQEPPSGRCLDATLHLILRLGHSRLTSKLPHLLKTVESAEDKQRVMTVLGNLRTEACVETLQDFLKNADAETEEELVCEAARGLGLTEDPKHLPLLRQVTSQVEPPIAIARLLAARHRCKDPKAGARLRKMLHRKEVPQKFRLELLNVLRRVQLEEMLPDLTDLALKAANEQLRTAAFKCMVDIVGYRNFTRVAKDQTEEDNPGGSKSTSTGTEPETAASLTPVERYRKADAAKRREMVAEVTEFWKKKSEKRKQAVRNQQDEEDPPLQ